MKKVYFGLSLLLASFVAKAQFPAPYCAEAFADGVEPITSVVFNTINQTSSASATVAHENYTTVTTSVQQGVAYTLSVKGNTGGDYLDGVVVYFDFNHNNVFTDAGEGFVVGVLENSTGVDAIVVSTSITIPPTALSGATRMRIIKRYEEYSAPCGTTSVDDFGQAEDYTLNVIAAPCAFPSNIQFSNVSGGSATISWTAGTGVTSYQYSVSNSSTVPTSGTATSTTTATVTGLQTNLPVYAYLRSVCSANTYTPWITKVYSPNDSCGTPIGLSGNTPVAGSNAGSTQSLAPVTCGIYTSQAALDVWYSFTVNATGNVTIALTNSSSTLDAILVGYSGACNSLGTALSCADASGNGGDETLTLSNIVAGQTYRVRVYGWASSTGTFTITATGTTLPVTGVNLSAIRNNKSVQLDWKTETEVNNAGFQIQRSADGKEFTSIMSVASKATNGNSSSTINYTAEDAKPFSGANYYRLKQTDRDGKVSYSNVVYLKGTLVNNLTVSAIYPNPTKDVLKAAIQSPAAETITFVITDMTGKIIARQNASVTSGDNTINLNVANLAAGSYLLKAICTNGCETGVQKFTKQ